MKDILRYSKKYIAYLLVGCFFAFLINSCDKAFALESQYTYDYDNFHFDTTDYYERWFQIFDLIIDYEDTHWVIAQLSSNGQFYVNLYQKTDDLIINPKITFSEDTSNNLQISFSSSGNKKVKYIMLNYVFGDWDQTFQEFKTKLENQNYSQPVNNVGVAFALTFNLADGSQYITPTQVVYTNIPSIVLQTDVPIVVPNTCLTNDTLVNTDVFPSYLDYINCNSSTNPDNPDNPDNPNQGIIDGIGDLNDSILDDSPPNNLENLGDTAGWLPPGPVDSILNLPLTFLQNLSQNLSGTCQPVTLTLPFVNEDINLPCVNTLYEQIDGLEFWLNSIGVVACGFILFKYLINLYKWVDDTLTFRENNWLDNWGGL